MFLSDTPPVPEHIEPAKTQPSPLKALLQDSEYKQNSDCDARNDIHSTFDSNDRPNPVDIQDSRRDASSPHGPVRCSDQNN